MNKELKFLNAFFGLRPVVLQVPCHLSWKMGDNEQNEAFIVQGEMVNALLHHLDVHKSMEPHKGTDGDCGRACHATFHHSPEVLANR